MDDEVVLARFSDIFQRSEIGIEIALPSDRIVFVGDGEGTVRALARHLRTQKPLLASVGFCAIL
jgi:hypothetical protein